LVEPEKSLGHGLSIQSNSFFRTKHPVKAQRFENG